MEICRHLGMAQADSTQGLIPHRQPGLKPLVALTWKRGSFLSLCGLESHQHCAQRSGALGEVLKHL